MPNPGINEEGFPFDLSDLPVTSTDIDTRASDYIKANLEVSAGEAKNYILTASAEAAIVIFLLKDSLKTIQDAGMGYRIAAAIAVLFLALSAASFYVYALAINSRRMGIARTLASGDARHARQLWATKDKRHEDYPLHWGYRRAQYLGYIGIGIGTSVATATIIVLMLTG